ncbi:MAG: CocE/NonD family hydrolase [Bacteroidia bacterium]|nr:CocE/NonD family hydrolase [Bacteroidia bacterium]
MKILRIFLPVLTGFFLLGSPGFSQSQDSSTSKSIDLIWGVKIPMRDGIQLNATVYKPKGAGPLPVIFTLTPYISDRYHNHAWYFSRNGYVFVLVDARGRGNSEGTFTPMLQEAKDGYDVVEWLGRQSWSNGNVAMWGMSYGGYDQWATAKEFPSHLKTIVPVASGNAGVDFPYEKNIIGLYSMQWLTYVSGVTPNTNLFGESSFWIQKFREIYLNYLPFKNLDKIAGNQSAIFQTWNSFPGQSAHWDAYNPSDEQFSKINMPILTITGMYDGDQTGAMEYYKKHMELAPIEAKDQHYLIIGPWDHAGTRTPSREVGGLTFGWACLLDMNMLHKDWYDWVFKSAKKPEFLKNRVAYYVTGKDVWKYAESLETISTEKRVTYLDSDPGVVNNAFHSGYLSVSQPVRSASDSFVYDPLDVRPAELDTAEVADYLTDQRYALNLFGNGLVYHTEPFTENTEISGYIKLSLWISMDVPDTDFEVNLYEITPDGNSILLTFDLLKARFRESLREEKLIEPGVILKYDFTGFDWFSREVAKGSRLRLVIKCLNSIYAQKNYNSGRNVMEESGKDARTAHITVYHTSKYPSILELPIGK